MTTRDSGGQQHSLTINWVGVGRGGELTQGLMFYITKSIGALTPGSLNGSYCPGPGPPPPKEEAEESAFLLNWLRLITENDR